MHADVERTIMHYYPKRALHSPLDDAAIAWDYDPDFSAQKSIIAELSAFAPDLRPGTRGAHALSEEVVLLEKIHLQLSLLGPWAALDFEHAPPDPHDDEVYEARRRVVSALEKHGVRILSDAELREPVAWIHSGSATVWQCLFELPA